MTIHAIYRDGALTLLEPLDLPDGTRVEVEVRADLLDPTAHPWSQQTPDERVAGLQRWIDAPRPSTPPISLEAIGRDSIYD